MAAELITQAAEAQAAADAQLAADEAIIASGQEPVAGSTVQKPGLLSNPLVLLALAAGAYFVIRGISK